MDSESVIKISKTDSSEPYESELIDSESRIRLVYFSSVTESTKRFVEKVGYPSERIPLYSKKEFLRVDYDYVLVVPTYGGGDNEGAVPKQVIKFLNDESNRSHCKGVIAGGNTNFGSGYCLAGKIISSKVKVPLLYNFELFGTSADVDKVRLGLREFWNNMK